MNDTLDDALSKNDTLSDTLKTVLLSLKQNPKATQANIAKETGKGIKSDIKTENDNKAVKERNLR